MQAGMKKSLYLGNDTAYSRYYHNGRRVRNRTRAISMTLSDS